jgi:hypothetical protein
VPGGETLDGLLGDDVFRRRRGQRDQTGKGRHAGSIALLSCAPGQPLRRTRVNHYNRGVPAAIS